MNLTSLSDVAKPSEPPKTTDARDPSDIPEGAFTDVFDDTTAIPRSQAFVLDQEEPRAAINTDAVTSRDIASNTAPIRDADSSVPVAVYRESGVTASHIGPAQKRGGDHLAATPQPAATKNVAHDTAIRLPHQPNAQFANTDTATRDLPVDMAKTGASRVPLETAVALQTTSTRSLNGADIPDMVNAYRGASPVASTAINTNLPGVRLSTVDSQLPGITASQGQNLIPVQPITAASATETVQVETVRQSIETRATTAATPLLNETPSTGPQTAAAPMSMLERHLAGHPPSIAAQNLMTASPLVSERGAHRVRLETAAPLVHYGTTTQSNQQTATIAHAPTPAQNATFPGAPTSQSKLQLVGADVHITPMVDDVSWDQRFATQAATTLQTAIQPRSDMGGAVVQQIADAMRRSSNRPVEIALNPVELGKVRMVLSATDAGITLTIQAERADTVELMRRNIDDLGKSFAEMGYEDVSFSFEGGSQMTDDAPPDDTDDPIASLDDIAVDRTSDLTTVLSTSTLAIAPDGIDLRL